MKITFVYPDFFQFDEENYMPEGRIYLGIGYLSACLKAAGHHTSLIHLVKPFTEEEWGHRLLAEEPDLLAFSATTHMFPHVIKLANWTKQRSDVLTICGGAHPTIDPEGALADSCLDIICRGEGEEALTELAGALQAGAPFEKIPSLWVRRGDTINRNPVRPLPEDLDRIPYPDRSIFDASNLCEQQHERGTLMASRGCPYNCSYCSNHVQKSIYPNKKSYVRFRSVSNVMGEVKQIIDADKDGKLRYIRFDDDILTIHRDWFLEFAAAYRSQVQLPFICNSRVNLLDAELVEAFADAGCSVICMGIESGSERLRKEVLNRSMSNERIEKAFRLCRSHGIKTVSTNMVALPGEKLEDLLETIRLNARAHPDCMQVSTYHPYPNTRLWQLCEEAGYLSGRHVDTIFDGRSALDTPESRMPEFEFARQHFYPLAELYRRRWLAPLLDLLFRRGRLRLLARLAHWQERVSKLEWIHY
ncbi:MAG: B12-binding domain-containing radical SAM protein [Candidatus Geothermincolia bacterium]